MDSIFESVDSTLASKALLQLLFSECCVAPITPLCFFLPLVLPLIACPKKKHNKLNHRVKVSHG